MKKIVLFLIMFIFLHQANAGVSPDINGHYSGNDSTQVGIYTNVGNNNYYYLDNFSTTSGLYVWVCDAFSQCSDWVDLRCPGVNSNPEHVTIYTNSGGYLDIDYNGGVCEKTKSGNITNGLFGYTGWPQLILDITTISPPIINATCGTANKNYAYNITNYGSDTFCELGTVHTSLLSFPIEGGSVAWICEGSGGGTNINCAATREGGIFSPISLIQYIKLPEVPELEKQEIPPATKVGKYQSGSGVILSAYVENSTNTQLRLEFEIYRLGASMPSIQLNTNYFSSGTGEVVVPYLGVGEYYWKVRTKTINGTTSDWIDYNTNYPWEYDYALFEGFEPYPYGYKFENSSPASGVLTGGYYNNMLPFPLVGWRIDGNKWDIFENAFDLINFPVNSRKYIAAYESTGLQTGFILINGNCYALSMSSLLHYKYPGFLQTHHSTLYSQVGSGTIWNNVSQPTINTNGDWTQYNDITKSIYSLQTSQTSKHQTIEKESNKTNNGFEILTKFSNNSDKNYILGIIWKNTAHAVVPYKREGNRLYFWDNILPGDYNQYLEVHSDDSWTFSYGDYNTLYGANESLTLMDIEKIYNGGAKGVPKGFNQTDTAYILDGTADMYLEDSLGRKTGFLQGNTLEQIPGAYIVKSYNLGNTNNNWKEIYLPEKLNLNVKIIGTSQDQYNLMIAGGDYYTKLENVPTHIGQLDTYNSNRENIKIDFDNSKNGSYNLLTDNFYNNGTGTIFMKDMPILGNKISYDINWSKVLSNSNDAVIYGVDMNNDGISDFEQELPPLYQYSIATLMSQPTIFEDDKDTSEEK